MIRIFCTEQQQCCRNCKCCGIVCPFCGVHGKVIPSRPGVTAALWGGEWSAARPGRTLPPWKTRYTLYRRLSGPQGRSGRAENLVPTGIRSRTVQPVAQSLYRLSYPAHGVYGEVWSYSLKKASCKPKHVAAMLFWIIYTLRNEIASECKIIQGKSLARGPKLLSIKNYVIEIMTWKFINTYRERCKTGPAHNRCWNWSPFTSKHTWMLFSRFWNTFPKVSMLTVWISWRIASLSCSIVRGCIFVHFALQ